MEIEKELSTIDGYNSAAKIKTHFAKIIVGGTAEKPYYEILYFDHTDRKYHVGFGSFCLEYVFKWLSEEFETVDSPTVDSVEVVRCKDCKFGLIPYGDEHDGWIECSNIHGRPIFGCDDFCSLGERRTDGES